MLLLLGAALLLVSPAFAQVRIPPAAIADMSRLDEVIRQGELLEQERRWSDALRYYEGALRDFPDRSELLQRMATARVHLDVARRYSDRSFLNSLQRLNEQQALDLFSEVLLKIETYHVSDPDWQQVLRQGMQGLNIAVHEPAFVDKARWPAAEEQVQVFSKQLANTVAPAQIRSRHQAREATATVARLADRYLGVAPQATIMEFTCAAVATLDNYSAYLTGDQLDDVFSQIEGNFVGLGIELKPEQQSLLIVNVIPGGPADLAGVQPNDRILEVDGKSMRVISTDVAADMLKGPELSFVEVRIERPDGTLRDYRIQRRCVEVPSVSDAQILDPATGTAYLKLVSFQKTTSQDMDRALWDLHGKGMRTLIVDLRGNPGGLLNAAVEVADKFLQAGTIVSTRGRSVREDFDYKANSVGTWLVPLIVLIDGESASASEILAGAIHDHRRGTVIGQRSYGKGSVQGIFPLSRYKSGVRLTTAKFYTPSGQAISNFGVTPDITVQQPARHTVARPAGDDDEVLTHPDEDLALQTALDVARRAFTQQHAARSK